MNPLLWLVSRCLPKDDKWVTDLVASTANDDLQPAEAYVDIGDDKVALGDEEYYAAKALVVESQKDNKSCWESMHRWRSAHSRHQRVPARNGPLAVPGTMVVWRELQRGQAEHFELLGRVRLNSTPSSNEAPSGGGANSADAEASEEDEEEETIPTPAFAKKVDSVDVIFHRRVHKKNRRPFICVLVNEIKAKLGVPTRTPANLLTVRHMVFTRCKEVNLRAIDTRRAVEMVIPLVFAPDDVDIEAAQLANSKAIRKQKARLAYEYKSPLFRWWVGRETYATYAWSATERVGTGNA